MASQGIDRLEDIGSVDIGSVGIGSVDIGRWASGLWLWFEDIDSHRR